jgi:hypothetical protein
MRTASLFVVVSTLATFAAACGGGAAQSNTGAPAAPAAPVAGGSGGVFTDATAYASAPPARTAAAAHSAKGVAAPGAKTPCLGCHKDGGAAPAFTFAGTIFADDGMSKGSADVEVRVADASGKGVSAHSDADGNFWVQGPALALPAHAGARVAGKALAMGSVVDKADCNGCHDATFPMLLKPVK